MRVAASLAALAAAASLLAPAAGLSSLPAIGAPCASVSPINPAYPQCNPNYIPTNYYQQMQTGTLNVQSLGLETNGGCDWIEDAFEETFASPILNTTRWIPGELNGQEHCVGLPPSGPTTCTMMSSNNVQLGQTFPDSMGGGVGAVLKLTQSFCQTNPGPLGVRRLRSCCCYSSCLTHASLLSTIRSTRAAVMPSAQAAARVRTACMS